MTNLVTLNDLSGYKYISDSVRNSAIWPQFVVEAQLLDVKQFLGDGLLSELLDQADTSPTSYSTTNETLLNGGKYTYGDNTYLFHGLKACIIYYAFARFASKMAYNFTAMGIVQKDSDLSTPASDKAIQRIVTEAELTGDSIRDEVILFLRRNYTDYPLYSYCQTSKQPRTWRVIGD